MNRGVSGLAGLVLAMAVISTTSAEAATEKARTVGLGRAAPNQWLSVELNVLRNRSLAPQEEALLDGALSIAPEEQLPASIKTLPTPLLSNSEGVWVIYDTMGLIVYLRDRSRTAAEALVAALKG